MCSTFFNITNPSFCPHSVLYKSHQTSSISLHNINFYISQWIRLVLDMVVKTTKRIMFYVWCKLVVSHINWITASPQRGNTITQEIFFSFISRNLPHVQNRTRTCTFFWVRQSDCMMHSVFLTRLYAASRWVCIANYIIQSNTLTLILFTCWVSKTLFYSRIHVGQRPPTTSSLINCSSLFNLSSYG
jgi:hypothetical protein